MLDFNIQSLPVDVLSIAEGAGIRVIKNSDVMILGKGENGKSFCDGKIWVIIYDDKNPTELSRYTIAHELGHILLGHELIYSPTDAAKGFTSKPRAENQAHMFALRLLCPACVLWALNISSADGIAKLCKVPLFASKQREKRLSELFIKNKFLTDPTEKQLFESFSDYIKLIKESEDKPNAR